MRMLWFVALLAGCYAPLDLPSSTSGTSTSVDCTQYASAEACGADSRCVAEVCDECGNEVFGGCAPIGTPPPECPAIPCQADCAEHTNAQACDANLDCVAVYEDPGTCDCGGVGCCMVFSRCDDGPADCTSSGPDCGLAPIVCGQGYEQIVEDGCVSGCVKVSSCASPD